MGQGPKPELNQEEGHALTPISPASTGRFSPEPARFSQQLVEHARSWRTSEETPHILNPSGDPCVLGPGAGQHEGLEGGIVPRTGYLQQALGR
jgi:hypothetical protein